MQIVATHMSSPKVMSSGALRLSMLPSINHQSKSPHSDALFLFHVLKSMSTAKYDVREPTRKIEDEAGGYATERWSCGRAFSPLGDTAVKLSLSNASPTSAG